MATEKIWHPKFIEYMNFIINHPNYDGLPIEFDETTGNPRWIATAKSVVGVDRKKWAEDKARQLGIPIEPGVYAKVMYAIHPTKIKTCQICGQEMSIGYIYPNANFAKSLLKEFDIEIGTYDSFYDIWDNILLEGYGSKDIIGLINNKFNTNFTVEDSKNDIIEKCEALCRLSGKAHLGPGAMSNFPDRYDGFHTYNRCHRSIEDKGRSKENLKSYTRDRRAYEYWSDGNIQAANQFMGSDYFKGVSADHVGPISLGFIHDSHYLRPMLSSDNSIKRDRLSKETVDAVVEISVATGIYPMSWYSAIIWDYIVENYSKSQDKIATTFRNLLKQNMANYMYILKYILEYSKYGEEFLYRYLILPKKDDFMYSYKFDSLGNVVTKTVRNITQRGQFEFERFFRIATTAVHEYNDKDNRLKW